MQRKTKRVEWEPRAHPAYLVSRAGRLFMRLVDERLKKLGFGAAHVPVLRALKNGEAMSQTELAALAQIEQPTMAQTLARLQRDGVVRRAPNPVDGRSSLFSLTPKALAKVVAVRDVVARGGHEMVAGLTAEEVAQLGALMRKVIANLEPRVAQSRAE
jgi:MarR family transcriptional regulator for hemolysin